MTALEAAVRTLPESIANLDLSDLVWKLLDDDEAEARRRNGERLWDEARAERAVSDYRQFLALMYWHPEAFLVPSEDIDAVWHTHVLHTARYQADCETIFGRFQHHAPTFGTAAEAQAELDQDGDHTLHLFEEAFGEIPQSYNVQAYGKCGRSADYGKCGRTTDLGKCGQTTEFGKCGRTAELGKCGRTADYGKCGRTADYGKCGRTAAYGKCGRTNAYGRCGRVEV